MVFEFYMMLCNLMRAVEKVGAGLAVVALW
jgi:hypothetical protein